MANDSHHSADTTAAPRETLLVRLGSTPSRLAAWIVSGKLPMAVAGVAALAVIAVMFGLWSYLAHLAVEAHQTDYLADALDALDAGDAARAKSLVARLHDEPAEPQLLGGALFVLGATKSIEADAEYSDQRRQAMHLVASRYLQRAQMASFPTGREVEGGYLLGRSLVLSSQFSKGIAVLSQLLDEPDAPQAEIHSLLVTAQLQSPSPDLASALHHNQQVLTDSAVSEADKEIAQLRQAEILLRLGELGRARAALESLSPRAARQPHVQLLLARIDYRAAAALPDHSARRDALLKVIAKLRSVLREAPAGDEVARRAMYWIARAYQSAGDVDPASEQFDLISKQHGDTPEGAAASMARAKLQLAADRPQRALAMFRQVLDGVVDPQTYANPLLPLSEIRKSLLAAYQQFLANEDFENALALVERLTPAFTRAEQIELQAKTNRLWGESLLAQGRGEKRWRGIESRQEGWFRLRTSGVAFERLARIRFATRLFTDDLWNAAEAYFSGQSFTNAARLYKEYLHHEVRLRNSMALLRLGQSKLAAGQPAAAIESLEECIEMYPRDAVVYQARLDAARASRQLGRADQAEELLRTNLAGDRLTPSSPEWRDSLFELGRMLYDLGRYGEAIDELLHAVDRYPDAEDSLMARYTIARAYHDSAEAPAKRLREAKTETDRQKNRRLLNKRLEDALNAYLEVQRMVTLTGRSEVDPLGRTVLRNCYLMQGSVLYDLGRFDEAREAYSNISGLYQNEPFVLESFVKIADCWRRMNDPIKARGAIEQAKLALKRLPPETDFRIATNFNRREWVAQLEQMSKW